MKNEKIRNFLLMTLGTVVTAVGVYFFKFANHFSFGGVTGIAVLVAKSGIISAADFSFIANMLLLLVGLIFLGRGFAARTAYCSILLSVLLSVMERVFPMAAPFTDEPLLELAFAVALPAMGSALLFNIGASSGGTDVIAMLVRKHSDFNIGTALLLTDILAAVAGCIVFDIKTGLFSFVGLAVRSFMIDGFIESLNLSKYFNVICSDPKPICEFITGELKRGATVVEATGAFSGQKKYIVISAMKRSQALRLRNFIHREAPDAFLLISNTSEIIGKGFHNI